MSRFVSLARRPPRLAALAALAVVALCAVACSKADKAAPSAAPPEPSASATATAAAPAAPPPAFDPNAPPAPTPSPVVVAPSEGTAAPSPKPAAQATVAPQPAAKPPPPKPKANGLPRDLPGDEDGLHATPAPTLGVKRIAVSANNHFTCSSTEKRDNVAAIAEPRGARISIIGQGPCPGEVHAWNAQVSERRVEVNGTHGTASKCRCVGSGELVLRGLDPGTYDVAVNGGFDRPIATRIVVSQ